LAQDEFNLWRRTLGPNPHSDPLQDLGSPLLTGGDAIKRIWRGMIFQLAKANLVDDALSLLQEFTTLYPPSLLTAYARAMSASENQSQPTLVRLSSSQFPETSTFHTSRPLPPHMLFRDLQLLHTRLVSLGDKTGIAAVCAIGHHYDAALKWAGQIAEGKADVKEGAIAYPPRSKRRSNKH